MYFDDGIDYNGREWNIPEKYPGRIKNLIMVGID
jgi:hypothetical protein